MIHSPLVSIIIPVYNAAETINRCLNSILIQPYDNLEIICIDDSSSDNSQELIHKYSDPRIKLLSQTHQGNNCARNLGLQVSQGEIITFVDADDYISENYIGQQVQIMLRGPSVDVVQTPYCMIDINGEIFPMATISTEVIVGEDSYLRAYFSGVIPAFVWSKFYKSSIAKQIVFPNIANSGDSFVQPTIAHISRKTKISLEGAYYYFQNPHSITNTIYTETKRASTLIMLQHTYGVLHQNETLQDLRVKRWQTAVLFLISSIKEYGTTNNAEYINFFSQYMPSYREVFNAKIKWHEKLRVLLIKIIGIKLCGAFLHFFKSTK